MSYIDRAFIFALSGVMFTAGMALAQAVPTQPLPRVGKWDLSYNDISCDLVGTFGEGDEQIVAKFTRYSPGDGFELALFAQQFELIDPGSVVRVGFGATIPSKKVSWSHGKSGVLPALWLGGKRLDGFEFNNPDDVPPKMSPAEIDRIDTLTVVIGSKTIQLQLGSMAGPMQGLDRCTDNLVRAWGYDPIAQASLSRPVTPSESPANWVSTHDYPSSALFKGQSSYARFRLDIDVKGRVTDCHILAVTDNASKLNDPTCNQMKSRARFSPALDAEGKPIPSFWVSSVLWNIPRRR